MEPAGKTAAGRNFPADPVSWFLVYAPEYSILENPANLSSFCYPGTPPEMNP